MTRHHALLALLLASLLPLALIAAANTQSKSERKPTVTATPDQDVLSRLYGTGR